MPNRRSAKKKCAQGRPSTQQCNRSANNVHLPPQQGQQRLHRDPTTVPRAPFAIPERILSLLRTPGMRHLILDAVEYHAQHGLAQLRILAPYVDVTRMVRDMRVQAALFTAGDSDYFAADLLMLDNVQACLAGGQPLWEQAPPNLRDGCRQIHKFLLDTVATIPDTSSNPPMNPGRPVQANPTPTAAATKAVQPVAWCDVDMFFREGACLGKLLRARGINATESSLAQLSRVVRASADPLPAQIFVFYSMDFIRNPQIVSQFVQRGGIFVYCGDFSDGQFQQMFPEITWKKREYCRGMAQVTAAGNAFAAEHRKGSKWSSKCVWLTNVPGEQALVQSLPGAQPQSLVPGLVDPNIFKDSLTSIALYKPANGGTGAFLYVGDVNLEGPTCDMMLDVLSLLSPQGSISSVQQQFLQHVPLGDDEFDEEDDDEYYDDDDMYGMDPWAAYGMAAMDGRDPEQAMMEACMMQGISPAEFFSGDY